MGFFWLVPFCCCGWLVVVVGFFCRERREKFHTDFVQQAKCDSLYVPELYLLFVLKSYNFECFLSANTTDDKPAVIVST